MNLNIFIYLFNFSVYQEDDKDAHDDVEKGSKGKGADHGEDFDADLQVSSSAFEALERDFQEVIWYDL